MTGEIHEIEFEIIEPPAVDHLGQIKWRMKGGEYILIKDMEDKHLRNAALFLMNMGYTKCLAPEQIRIMWLRIFAMEWERRLLRKKVKELREWTVNDD